MNVDSGVPQETMVPLRTQTLTCFDPVQNSAAGGVIPAQIRVCIRSFVRL